MHVDNVLGGREAVVQDVQRPECGNMARVTADEALLQRRAARGSPGWVCPAMAGVKPTRTNQEEGMGDDDCGYGQIYV